MHKGPYREKMEAGGSESEREETRMEAEVREERDVTLLALMMEGVRSQGIQVASRNWKRIFSKSLQK